MGSLIQGLNYKLEKLTRVNIKKIIIKIILFWPKQINVRSAHILYLGNMQYRE